MENEKRNVCSKCSSIQGYCHYKGVCYCIPCRKIYVEPIVAKEEAEYQKKIEAKKEEGRKYWEKRGIKVGQKVYSFAPSMLGFGGIKVEGIAKVGKVGAYVQSKFQKGYLSPDSFGI